MIDRPFLIDVHSHINFRAYREDVAEVIARAEAENIWMLAVGSQIDTSRRAVEWAEKYPHIWAVVGLHPLHLFEMTIDAHEVGGGEGDIAFQTRSETFDPAAYQQLAEHPKTVAIGECG
ncbi:MAG: TatD family hydrolase, partial [Candidatus Uhrbacteria bacterium]